MSILKMKSLSNGADVIDKKIDHTQSLFLLCRIMRMKLSLATGSSY